MAEYMKDRLDNPWDHQVEFKRIDTKTLDSCEGLREAVKNVLAGFAR